MVTDEGPDVSAAVRKELGINNTRTNKASWYCRLVRCIMQLRSMKQDDRLQAAIVAAVAVSSAEGIQGRGIGWRGPRQGTNKKWSYSLPERSGALRCGAERCSAVGKHDTGGS